jgi:hypothetical protein
MTGKAARARLARQGVDVKTDLTKHRPCGGAPININIIEKSESDDDDDDLTSSSSDDNDIISIQIELEEFEQLERVKYRPHLITRKDVPMDNHGSMVVPITTTTIPPNNTTITTTSTDTSKDVTTDRKITGTSSNNSCDLSEHNLRGEFTLDLMLFPTTIPTTTNFSFSLSMLTDLDLSRNEIWDLPSYDAMDTIPNLQKLNLSRNWFSELPISIGKLYKLQYLNVSHNMLRSSKAALLLLPPALSTTVTMTTDDDTSTTNDGNKNSNSSNNNDSIVDNENNNNNINNNTDTMNKNNNNDADVNSIITILRSLECLIELDLTFNQKCGHQKLKDKIEKELYNNFCDLKMTINFPPPNRPSPTSSIIIIIENDGGDDGDAATSRIRADFVGASAAVRNPNLLRSQLECWSTTALRRRLVADFGQEPSCPIQCTRSDVMDQLLSLYAEENNEYDHDIEDEYKNSNKNKGDTTTVQCQRAQRKIIRTDGILIKDESLRNDLLSELKGWKSKWTDKNNERTSINAENYMILTSPASWESVGLGRKKRFKAEKKLNEHKILWDLAKSVMSTVDKDFSNRYTALAVTHNFIGSPHIDRQNVGPFYGLSLGDFDDNTGGVMVECSARIVAHVNTKNRLGKVDGRFPHWVAPYDHVRRDRYSLIFYQTSGEFQKIGPPIFKEPITTFIH